MVQYVQSTRERIENHLRSHLTDSHWHDDCRYCLTRRRYGGNGVDRCGWCGHNHAHRARCEVDASNADHPGAICGCRIGLDAE